MGLGPSHTLLMCQWKVIASARLLFTPRKIRERRLFLVSGVRAIGHCLLVYVLGLCWTHCTFFRGPNQDMVRISGCQECKLCGLSCQRTIWTRHQHHVFEAAGFVILTRPLPQCALNSAKKSTGFNLESGSNGGTQHLVAPVGPT